MRYRRIMGEGTIRRGLFCGISQRALLGRTSFGGFLSSPVFFLDTACQHDTHNYYHQYHCFITATTPFPLVFCFEASRAAVWEGNLDQRPSVIQEGQTDHILVEYIYILSTHSLFYLPSARYGVFNCKNACSKQCVNPIP